MPELSWLEDEANATLVRKDCINGFVGAIRRDGSNALVDWLNQHEITDALVVGICTDICVMDMVLTLLSGRNHGMVLRRCRGPSAGRGPSHGVVFYGSAWRPSG